VWLTDEPAGARRPAIWPLLLMTRFAARRRAVRPGRPPVAHFERYARGEAVVLLVSVVAVNLVTIAADLPDPGEGLRSLGYGSPIGTRLASARPSTATPRRARRQDRQAGPSLSPAARHRRQGHGLDARRLAAVRQASAAHGGAGAGAVTTAECLRDDQQDLADVHVDCVGVGQGLATTDFTASTTLWLAPPMVVHPMIWTRRRLAVPGHEPDELPAALGAALQRQNSIESAYRLYRLHETPCGD
jgi:hypothetical protein